MEGRKDSPSQNQKPSGCTASCETILGPAAPHGAAAQQLAAGFKAEGSECPGRVFVACARTPLYAYEPIAAAFVHCVDLL